MERRRRLITRTLPLAIIASVAFVVGAVHGAPGSPEKDAAERFAEAWEEKDFGAMYRELNPASQTRDLDRRLRDRLPRRRRGGDHALARGRLPRGRLRGGRGRRSSRSRSTAGRSPSARSRATSSFPTTTAASPGTRRLVFPGLRRDEHLENEIELAPRAPILAADGSPLAEGDAEAREHPLGSSAIDITGEVGTAEEEDLPALERRGFSAETPVGVSGLEQAFNSSLAGRPGGSLLAVSGETAARPGSSPGASRGRARR